MRHSGIPLSALPPHLQAQINAQTSAPAIGQGMARASAAPAAAAPEEKRLRQSSKPILNRLEASFLVDLKYMYPTDQILSQAIRLELARGLWYKPDFFIPAVGRPRAIAYEVKGPHAFRGGFENLKSAARTHTWVQFFLTWQDPDTRKWKQQEILP